MTTTPMTREEILALPMTIGIELAARALGIGRTTAYQLARNGEFPIEVTQTSPRSAYLVRTSDLHRILGLTTETAQDSHVDALPARIAAGQLDRDLDAIATDASRLSRLVEQFTAGLSRREPIAGAATQLAQMSLDLASAAARIDALRDVLAVLAGATERTAA